MSMDDYGRDADKPVTEQEGVMFAANPIWERGKKRRGFGRKSAKAAPAAPVTPEPRSFVPDADLDEPMALDRPVDRPDPATTYAMGPAAATPPTPAAEEADAGLVAPIGRAATAADREPKSKGTGPAAILAAGAVALVAAGAVGWYATRDSEGVPELTPGAMTSEVATAPLPPVDLPGDPGVTAQDMLPERAAQAAAEPPRQTVRVARAAPARTRPAAAASADASGIDASTPATLPQGPQPYSTLNPATAPTTVNPATPPAQAAPEPIPSTPPTITPEPFPAAPAPQETTTPPL